MPTAITNRFGLCVQALLDSKRVRSARQFAEEISCFPQALNEVLKARREVSIEMLEKAILKFDFNTEFIFRGIGPMFIKETMIDNLKILTVICDSKDRNKIVHVPIEAHAGYALQQSNASFIEELPSYHLPQSKFKIDSTMRSFDVKGESMNPIFNNADIVICTYVHAFDWERNINENKYYVIISKEGIVLKKISNRVKQESLLLMHSENQDFASYAISIHDIIEIWEVRAKITSNFNIHNSPSNQLHKLEERFDRYDQMLDILQRKFMVQD